VTARKTTRKLGAEELFEFAVKCLGARAYSTGDLRLKLRLRAMRAGDVESAVTRLKEIGYLDDRRFAESFATARVENNGFGRTRVLSDLRARRVSGRLAEEAVERALDGKSEGELIDAYIARRMPSIAAEGAIDDERKLATAYRRLRRAGFTSSGILAALKRIAARPEILDSVDEEEEQD
jgi:regulatory protein